MRARIKFSKYDTMRFIGHLDIQRYFQRLFNRANLPMKYSEGFHPHQILSFAQPLSLGVTSDGEYLDIELTEDVDTDEITKILNEKASQGIFINKTVRISDREDNKKLVTCMSLIERAVYLIIIKDDAPCFDIKKVLSDFLSSEKINVIKKTKKGEKEIDLKEFIYEVYDFTSEPDPVYIDPSAKPVVTTDMINSSIVHAPDYVNGRRFIISLAAGSEININPELFINTLSETMNCDFDSKYCRIHRMELLGRNKNESVPLCQIL